jgi:hypothetical protein
MIQAWPSRVSKNEKKEHVDRSVRMGYRRMIRSRRPMTCSWADVLVFMRAEPKVKKTLKQKRREKRWTKIHAS